MPLLPSTLPPPAALDGLLASIPARVHRVVCLGGVTLRRGPGRRWGVATERADARPEAPLALSPTATLRALGLDTPPSGVAAVPAWGAPDMPPGRGASRGPRDARAEVERWTPVDPDHLAAVSGVRPVVLVAGDGEPVAGDAALHLVSAAGSTGWRPPLEALAERAAFVRHALRLRFLVDAAEQRAVAGALRYAAAADAARRTAALLAADDLVTLAVPPALLVEADALLGLAGETLTAVGRLVEHAFAPARTRGAARGVGSGAARPARPGFEARVLRARGAPPELRDALLEVWETHGVLAAGHRRAIRRAAAAELGPPTVRVHRVADVAWAVRAPVAPEPAHAGRVGATTERRARHDALALGWCFATDAWRAATLAIYAALED